MRRARRTRADDDGFTLIELLVVVVIIGILIAIAIPVYLNYKKGAADKSAQSDLRNAVGMLETCYSDTNVYPTSVTVNTANGACTGKQINISGGTTLSYFPNNTTTPTSYLIVATNSNGSVTGATNGYYCYASVAGGSVAKKTASTTPTAYATSC